MTRIEIQAFIAFYPAHGLRNGHHVNKNVSGCQTTVERRTQVLSDKEADATSEDEEAAQLLERVGDGG
jgi:hypothetical protein